MDINCRNYVADSHSNHVIIWSVMVASRFYISAETVTLTYKVPY